MSKTFSTNFFRNFFLETSETYAKKNLCQGGLAPHTLKPPVRARFGLNSPSLLVIRYLWLAFLYALFIWWIFIGVWILIEKLNAKTYVKILCTIILRRACLGTEILFSITTTGMRAILVIVAHKTTLGYANNVLLIKEA